MNDNVLYLFVDSRTEYIFISTGFGSFCRIFFYSFLNLEINSLGFGLIRYCALWYVGLYFLYNIVPYVMCFTIFSIYIYIIIRMGKVFAFNSCRYSRLKNPEKSISMGKKERALIVVFILCCKVQFGASSHSVLHRTIDRFPCMLSFYQVSDHYSHVLFLFSLFFVFSSVVFKTIYKTCIDVSLLKNYYFIP